MEQYIETQPYSAAGTGRLSLEKRIVDAWNIFSDNLVLIVPAFAIGFLNLLVYGGLAALFFILCLQDLSGFAFSLSDPSSFPVERLGVFIMQSVSYIAGFIMIAGAYQVVVGILHGAGWSNMFARAAVTGRTDLGDYMAGIGNFSGRMFGMLMVRTSIILLPVIAVLLIAVVFAMIGGGNGAGAGVAIAVIGLMLSIPVIGIMYFAMWMWRPAMFVRDMPLMDAFREGLRFTGARLADLVVLLLVWIAVTSVLSMFFSSFNMMFQFMGSGIEDNATGSIIVLLMFAARVVSGFFFLCLKVYYNVMYFKFYADEYAAGPPSPPAGSLPHAPPPFSPPASQFVFPAQSQQTRYPQATAPHPLPAEDTDECNTDVSSGAPPRQYAPESESKTPPEADEEMRTDEPGAEGFEPGADTDEPSDEVERKEDEKSRKKDCGDSDAPGQLPPDFC